MTSQADFWGFPVQWSNAFEEELAYRTTIITSRDGTEQRIAQRTKPRRQYTFTNVLVDDGVFDVAFARVSENQGALIKVPYPAFATTLAAAAVFNQTGLTLSGAAPTWLASGVQAAIVRPGFAKSELVDVSGVAGTALTLTDGLLADVPLGSQIMQVRSGRFNGNVQIRTGTVKHATAEIQFDVDPVTAFLTADAAPESYNDREVWSLPPNWAGGVQHGLAQDAIDVDFLRGAVDSVFPVPHTSRTTQLRYLLRDPSQLDTLLHWFVRSRGRQKAFYAPTWSREIVPVGDIADGATSITVLGRDVYDGYAASNMYKNIALKTVSRGFLYYGVQSITLNGSGNSVINTTTSMAAVPLSDLYWAGWLLRYRFASDLLSLEWLTQGLYQTTITLLALPDLDASWDAGDGDSSDPPLED